MVLASVYLYSANLIAAMGEDNHLIKSLWWYRYHQTLRVTLKSSVSVFFLLVLTWKQGPWPSVLGAPVLQLPWESTPSVTVSLQVQNWHRHEKPGHILRLWSTKYSNFIKDIQSSTCSLKCYIIFYHIKSLPPPIHLFPLHKSDLY